MSKHIGSVGLKKLLNLINDKFSHHYYRAIFMNKNIIIHSRCQLTFSSSGEYSVKITGFGGVYPKISNDSDVLVYMMPIKQWHSGTGHSDCIMISVDKTTPSSSEITITGSAIWMTDGSVVSSLSNLYCEFIMMINN